MIALIHEHPDEYGVDPIWRVLKTAPSMFHANAASRVRPETAPPQIRRDAALNLQILRVFNDNLMVHGNRKVRRQLKREGFDIARLTVSRLMRAMELRPGDQHPEACD